MTAPLNPTYAAALGVRISGATVSMGAQTNVLDANGGFPSNTYALSLTPVRNTAIPGVWIVDVSGANGPGVGTLEAITTGSLRWRAPGDTPGATVAIALGETRALFSNDKSKYIVVRRASTGLLTGTEAVQLADTYNNVVGGQNFYQSDTASGADKYLSVLFVNQAASGDITALKVWCDSDNTADLEIGTEAPTAGAIQTVADIYTAPTAVSFSAPTSSGSALSIGTLAPGAVYGLWIHQSVSMGADASAHLTGVIHYSFTYGGTDYTGQLRGLVRRANGDSARYELYSALGVDPVPGVDTPVATSATLPVTATTSYTEGIYHTFLARRNEWGLICPLSEVTKIAVNGSGEVYAMPPHGPAIVHVDPAANGAARISLLYQPVEEGTTDAAIQELRANKWALFIRTDGTDPDPGVDTATEQDMRVTDPTVVFDASNRQREVLFYTTDEMLDGTPIRVLPRTRRDDGDTVTDSTNTTIYEATASTLGPVSPRGYTTFDGAHGQYQNPATVDATTYYIDEPNDIRFEYETGRSAFYAGADLVWRCVINSDGEPIIYLPSDWTMNNATITGSTTVSGIEVASWSGTHILYVCVNRNRRMKIDVDAKAISVDTLTQDDLTDYQSPNPVFPRFADTAFVVFDAAVEAFRTYLDLSSAGVLTSAYPWNQTLDQTAIEAL